MSKIISINPSNYEVLGSTDSSSEEEIIEKVKKAQKAKYGWKMIGFEKRGKYLIKLAELFLQKKEEIAQLVTKEIGMPISQSRFDVDVAVDFFKWYIDNAAKYISPEIVHKGQKTTHTVFYEPIGTSAVITPWNFPLSNFVWGTAQSLIAGNTIIYKASEECSLFAKFLETAINTVELPDGVLCLVFGDGKVGDFLIHQNINLISFTGSSNVGKHVYQVAGEKFIKAVCEMGGSGPGIVFSDSNLDIVTDTVYENRFTNCGQICDALKRLIVHESIFNEVVDRLKIKLLSVKVGNPEDESTQIGPLVSKRQLELIEEQVKDAVNKGAKVIIGGKRVENSNGAFYMPTLLTNITEDMRVWKEEVFGPILPISCFDTDDKAVKMANDTNYGLGSYIFTKDSERITKVASQIDSGMISVNGVSYIKPGNPFGGYKDSGMGRQHGKFGFLDLTQVKVVATNNN